MPKRLSRREQNERVERYGYSSDVGIVWTSGLTPPPAKPRKIAKTAKKPTRRVAKKR